MAKAPAVSPFAPATLAKLPPIDGVRFATAEAGIRYKGRTDVLVAVMDEGTVAAGVLTQSKTASAPVLACRKHLKKGTARILVVNSGNANAFTGKKGRDAVDLTVEHASEAVACKPHDVFVASTGVIGEPLDASKFSGLLAGMAKDAKPDAFEAA
ncbi:MAG: bifunctional ornithine acetyltransferase/N-acetylglutamate synthase, partial [Hyphomicrobium sp.]